MPDPRAVTRVLDELLWSLRRAGFAIATPQARDALRAVALVGLEDRDVVRDAIAAVVLQRAADRRRFDRVFDDFFTRATDRARTGGTLWERLGASGFTELELGELRGLLDAIARAPGGDADNLGALLERGADLDHLLTLAGVARSLDAMQSPLQAGFFAHRVLGDVGVPLARRSVAALRSRLRDALGERGDALADALERELDAASDDVVQHVRAVVSRREAREDASGAPRRATTKPFTSLTEADVAEVRRAVRALSERLRGGARVRRRRAKKGRLDPHRTIRRAMATGGVPFAPIRKKPRPAQPRLYLLCDVSDSVRAAAAFMLELVYSAHELFSRTRSFVFVSELGETTDLFETRPIDEALGRAYGGGVVSVHDNSNYGKVLRAFEERHLRDIDRRTTVVILGDGRTNYHPDAADVLDRIKERARALLWLCPESRGAWATGDSAMPRYERSCTKVLEVRTARELEDAARSMLALR
jgi:uncharacterized protein with von Willebrand factor type A (vWA) domain